MPLTQRNGKVTDQKMSYAQEKDLTDFVDKRPLDNPRPLQEQEQVPGSALWKKAPSSALRYLAWKATAEDPARSGPLQVLSAALLALLELKLLV